MPPVPSIAGDGPRVVTSTQMGKGWENGVLYRTPGGLELEVEVRRGKMPMMSDGCKDGNRTKSCTESF